MERLKVMLAGAERLSSRALRAQLETRQDVDVVADEVSGAAALASLENIDPDVVFLDMQVPVDHCLTPRQPTSLDVVLGRVRQARFVSTTDIDWIEAVGNSVRLHTRAEAHLMNAAIGELEQKLAATRFMRIHRSTIVNLDRIAHIEPCGTSDYQVVLLDGTTLRVSRSSRDRLLKNTL